MRLLVVVCCLAGCAVALEFQGCFKKLEFREGEDLSRNFENFNINADCAAFCGSLGYILAATHKEECHCTNRFPQPENIDKYPNELKLLGGTARNPCNLPCPGAYVSGSGCVGDECCGGEVRNNKRYSLYAVGGIDPVSVYLKRIYHSLQSPDRNHPWLKVNKDRNPTCYGNFQQMAVMGHKALKVDLSAHAIGDYWKIGSGRVSSSEACQRECINYRGWVCQSVTYFFEEQSCILHRHSSLNANVTLSNTDAAIYNRNCTHVVSVLPSSFQMDVVKQLVSNQFGYDGDVQAQLDTENVEIDLTESNSFETVHRTISVSTEEELSTSTMSGFVSAQSLTTSQESEESTGSSNSKTSGFSGSVTAGFGFSVGASASVGFGAKGSVESEFTANFEASHTSSSESSASESKSQSKSRGTSRSNSETESMTQGHTESRHRTTSSMYEYSMTVPPKHKGLMAFFTRNKLVIRKIATLLRLDGYLKMKIIHNNGQIEERDVHVSRVLSPSERYVNVLAEQAFERQVLLAKVTITDAQGNLITSDEQIVEKKEK